MKRLALVVALALPILASACSETPVAPASRPQNAALSDGGLGKVARYKTNIPRVGTTTSKVIGPAGGSVSVAGFEIIVPPNAVTSPTVFSITLPWDAKKWDRVIADFGPSGMQFDVPVTITLPYQGTSSEDAALPPHVLWNNGLDWVALPSWLTSDGRIQTQTNHFSEYGTEDPGRGITTAGG
jgi:hypothetical protein